MLDGQATDALEASALGFRGDHIDIYINCWGPKDDGKTFGKPGPMAANALRTGAQQVGCIEYNLIEGFTLQCLAHSCFGLLCRYLRS